MAAISLTEQAAIVRSQVNELEGQKELPAGTIIYRHDTDLYFVAPGEDFDEDEEGLLEEITQATHFGYGSAYPQPLNEHVVTGEHLVMSPVVLKAAIAFLRWVRYAEEADNDEEYVLIMPGALITAMFDQRAVDQVECYLYFPIETRLLEDADRMKQAKFAVSLINGLARNIHVVFDGQVVKDVIPNSSSRKLVREYEESIEDDDPPVIVEEVEQMYAWLVTQAETLRAWLDSKERDVLPPDTQVVNYGKGILGNQNEGFVTLYGDDYEVPENVLEKIRNGDIFD